MTINIQTQATPFGSYTNQNASLFANLKISISYSHPAMASWKMYAPQHEMPLTPGHLIRIWDDAGTDPDGSAYSSSNPLFEGHIQAPKPGSDGVSVEYTAYDPTHRAQNETNVMSAAWTAGTVPGTKPVEATGAYPRLVLNATAIQNDDDCAFSRAENQTVQNIIEGILSDQYHPLYWISAAPGDGTSAGNGVAYTTADLASMNYEVQEKVVFESENVRSAIDRMLQWEPTYRMQWRPGTRKWRFFDITAGTEKTVTLNDFSGDSKVLSMEIDRSLEGRFTAVKFYGPELLQLAEFRTDNGTLSEVAGAYEVLERLGSFEVISYNRWQITDSTKRRIGRLLPSEVSIGVGGYNAIPTRAPTLQASWDGGLTWAVIQGAYFDFQNGVAYTGNGLSPWIHSDHPQVTPIGNQHYFPPTTVRLIAAYYDTPIATRYPTSGFSGTAYDVAGLQNEMKLYDEMLAVDYTQFGTPVTTTARLAKFNTLAQKIHAERKNIVYVGGMTLDGLVYGYAHLNRRINIAGVDENGDPLTTGWESIGAYLTDVEYDFETQLTTLQFSSDQMSLMGVDVEQMKKRLRIMALQRRDSWTFWSRPVYSATIQPSMGGAVLPVGWEGGAVQNTAFVDPNTGKVEETF